MLLLPGAREEPLSGAWQPPGCQIGWVLRRRAGVGDHLVNCAPVARIEPPYDVRVMRLEDRERMAEPIGHCHWSIPSRNHLDAMDPALLPRFLGTFRMGPPLDNAPRWATR